MKRLPQLIIFIGVFLTILASANVHTKPPANAHTKPPATTRIKSVIAFGDSQLDPGNNQYIPNCSLQANFPPYGSAYFHHPTGRFTNGRTTLDFFAQFMGTPFQLPYQEIIRKLNNGSMKVFPTNGVNFASAGSGVLPETNNRSLVTSLQGQTQQFMSLIYQKRLFRRQVLNSIIVLVSGSNDIFSFFLVPGGSKKTPEEYARAMLKETILFINKLYMNGGRRFALMSIGPMGCIPGRVLIKGTTTKKCVDGMDDMVKYYNNGLKLLVRTFPRRYPRAIAVYGVVYDTVEKYRDNAKAYGFMNVTDACCGAGPLNGKWQCGLIGYKKCSNPNEYFFYDYFHPSERTYGLLSKALWSGGKDVIWPINLKMLTGHFTKHVP